MRLHELFKNEFFKRPEILAQSLSRSGQFYIDDKQEHFDSLKKEMEETFSIIQAWINEHISHEASIIIPEFVTRYFQNRDNSAIEPEILFIRPAFLRTAYGDSKARLEMLSQLLQSPNIPHSSKVNAMKAFLDSDALKECFPGYDNRLQDLIHELSSIKIEEKLYNVRKNVLYELTLLFLKQYEANLSSGESEIHDVNRLLMMVKDDYGLLDIEDDYMPPELEFKSILDEYKEFLKNKFHPVSFATALAYDLLSSLTDFHTYNELSLWVNSLNIFGKDEGYSIYHLGYEYQPDNDSFKADNAMNAMRSNLLISSLLIRLKSEYFNVSEKTFKMDMGELVYFPIPDGGMYSYVTFHQQYILNHDVPSRLTLPCLIDNRTHLEKLLIEDMLPFDNEVLLQMYQITFATGNQATSQWLDKHCRLSKDLIFPLTRTKELMDLYWPDALDIVFDCLVKSCFEETNDMLLDIVYSKISTNQDVMLYFSKKHLDVNIFTITILLDRSDFFQKLCQNRVFDVLFMASLPLILTELLYFEELDPSYPDAIINHPQFDPSKFEEAFNIVNTIGFNFANWLKFLENKKIPETICYKIVKKLIVSLLDSEYTIDKTDSHALLSYVNVFNTDKDFVFNILEDFFDHHEGSISVSNLEHILELFGNKQIQSIPWGRILQYGINYNCLDILLLVIRYFNRLERCRAVDIIYENILFLMTANVADWPMLLPYILDGVVISKDLSKLNIKLPFYAGELGLLCALLPNMYLDVALTQRFRGCFSLDEYYYQCIASTSTHEHLLTFISKCNLLMLNKDLNQPAIIKEVSILHIAIILNQIDTVKEILLRAPFLANVDMYVQNSLLNCSEIAHRLNHHEILHCLSPENKKRPAEIQCDPHPKRGRFDGAGFFDDSQQPQSANQNPDDASNSLNGLN